MGQDHERGEASGASEIGVRSWATIDEDEMRAQMRLRLADNGRRRRQSDAGADIVPGVAAGQQSGIGTLEPGSPTPAAASHSSAPLVWQSILDSLATPTARPTPTPLAALTPLPPLTSPPAPVATPAVPSAGPEVPLPTLEVAPLPAVADLGSIVAELSEALAGLDAPADPGRAAQPAVVEPPIVASALEVTAETAVVDAPPPVMRPSLAAKPVRSQADGPASSPKAALEQVVPARPGKIGATATGAVDTTPRRTKRHPVRSTLLLMLVLALLGAASFAGWYKFIRHNTTWADDVLPSATFVEQTVHRTFTHSVPVVTLSTPEYEVKLGVAVLGRVDGSAFSADVAPSTPAPPAPLLAQRAVGLVGNSPAPSQVGHLAAASMMAFYNITDQTIYRLPDDTALAKVGLIRALTAAIVDQGIGEQSTMSGLTLSQQAGLQALMDGAVLRVIDAEYRLEPALATSAGSELETRRDRAGITAGGLPVYLSGVLTSAEYGVSGSETVPADNPLAGLTPPPSDAVLFDPLLAPSDRPIPVHSAFDQAAPAMLGTEFWFETLLPTLGVDDARAAALLWRGEAATLSSANDRACLTSTIATATADDATRLVGLMQRWAGSMPTSSAATVTLGVDGEVPTVGVSLCEPTEAVTPPTAAPADLAQFFTRVGIERSVVRRAVALELPETAGATNCVIAAFRNGALPGFTLDALDPPTTEALTNVVAFCRNS